MIDPVRAVATCMMTIACSASGPLPPIAGSLPPTWPPPGWPTRLTLPGESQPPLPQEERDQWTEVFEHVRINRSLRAVEFDAEVVWDFLDPATPRSVLELLVCLPLRDKEHESLLMCKARGAHVHAALLLVGHLPGTPGTFIMREDQQGKQELARVAPTGAALDVWFCYQAANGEGGTREVVEPALTWVVDERAKRPAATPELSMVFGGAALGQRINELGEKINVYAADDSGTLISLCTFGTETVGPTLVVSPDSGMDAPRFVANTSRVQKVGTVVRVRLTPAKVQ